MAASLTNIVRAVSRVTTGRTAAIVPVAYAIVIAALGLRFHIMGDGEAETDFFGAYVVQARAFLDGSVIIDDFRGPLYPIILALAGRVLALFGAGLFETGIVLSALSAGVTLWLVRRLLAGMLGAGPAFAGMLLVACNPLFVRYSYTASTDMVFVMLAMAAATTALATDGFSWRRAIVTAVLLSLAYLVRYNGIALVVGVVAAVVLANVWELPWRRRLAAAGAVLAVFAVLITPWGIYRTVERDSFFYSRNHMNVLYSLLPENSDTERLFGADISGYENVFEVIAAAPGLFFSQLPARAGHQLVSDAGGTLRWPLAILAVAGLASLALRRPSRREVGWYVVAACFFGALLFVFYNPRFGLLLVPAYVTLAVRTGRALQRPAMAGVAAAVAVVVVAWSAVASVEVNRRLIHGGDAEVRAVGEWFRANETPQGPRVVARKPAFAYFAGLDPVPLPVIESHPELLEYLESRDVDYLFFSYIAHVNRPRLAYLSDPDSFHPRLEVIHVSPAAVLYRVKRAGAP